MYNYVVIIKHNAIIMINNDLCNDTRMDDILMLMIVMDIIPNYNYFILFHYRGVCIHLYLLCLLM